MYLPETIAAEAVCSGEVNGSDLVTEDDYTEQGFSDDEYYSEEEESSFTSSISSSNSYSSSFSSSTTPTLTSSRPIPRPSILDNAGQSGAFSDNLRPIPRPSIVDNPGQSETLFDDLRPSTFESLVPTYLSPFGRDAFGQGRRGRTGRKPATRFENLPSDDNQRKLSPRGKNQANPGQNTARRAKAPELLPITDGLARPRPRSRPRSGKALSQKEERVKQGNKLLPGKNFPPKTEDIARLRNWSTWHGSISTTEIPRVGRLHDRRKALVGEQTKTFPNSSFPPSRLHVPSGPAKLKSNSLPFPSSRRNSGEQDRKAALRLKNEESVNDRVQAGNSNTFGPKNKPTNIRRQPNTIFHSNQSKKRPNKKTEFQRRRNKFDGTITTSAPSFFQSSNRKSFPKTTSKFSRLVLGRGTGTGKEQPKSSNSRSSPKTTSRFSLLLPGTGRGQTKSSQLRSTELPMDSREESNGHVGNGVKGAERRFHKTMKEEVQKNLVTQNAPQTKRPERVRGSLTSQTQMEEFMKPLNGRLKSKVTAPKTQKSKAPNAISEQMSRKSKKQAKEGRLGKALRKQAVGKALFTVEEWLRRG